MSPMSMHNTLNGHATKRDILFYEARAKGGAGLIVFANMQWDKERYDEHSGALLISEEYIPSLKEVTDTVHKYGCAMFAQLMHMGRYASAATQRGLQPVAPSAIPTRFNKFEMPRELTREEIQEFVRWQAEAAGIAKKAGFDGIEIETNSGYLYGQFFSPLTNHRSDEYGGDIYGRTRFMTETLQAIRDEVGPEFPISIRISGNDFVPGSCNCEDIADICEVLDRTGLLDAISVTAGWHESAVPLISMEVPNASFAYMGRDIKKRVSCVVAQGMRMNIPTAEELVERGDVDMAVLGRLFLADPQLVEKAAAGRVEDIRPCMGCNAGCIDIAFKNQPAGCVINAECNNESFYADDDGKLPTEKRSGHPEKILVIGGGISGMEFARVASLRGHKVTILEKRMRTGGLSLLAATPPRRHDIAKLDRWLSHTCRELGVDIRLGCEADEAMLRAMASEYDRIVLACGCNKITLPFPVAPEAHVVHAWDVLENKAELGKNVVVVGGGATGVETAMFIAEIGTLTAEQLRFMMIFNAEPYDKLKQLLNTGSKHVSVVEMGHKFALDITPGCRWSIMARVKQLGVGLYADSKVLEIKRDSVLIEGPDGKTEIACDSVVIAAGAKPNGEFAEKLSDLTIPVSSFGDAVSVGKIPDAIRSAYKLAAEL